MAHLPPKNILDVINNQRIGFYNHDGKQDYYIPFDRFEILAEDLMSFIKKRYIPLDCQSEDDGICSLPKSSCAQCFSIF